MKPISHKKRIEVLKEKARKHSISEGIFATAKNSFGNLYLSPFAIAINMSSSLVAMLSSLSGLLGPLSQIFGSKLIGKYSRKKIILKTVFYESLIWIPMILIAILFNKGILVGFLPILFLISFSVYIIIANLGGPAWFSWMGDIVDEEYRGRWFSKRNLIMGFVSIVLGFLASIFLDYFKNNNWTMIGFSILFFMAFISRMMSWKIFKKQYDPKIKIEKKSYFSFWDFLIQSPKTNFGKFAIFRALLSFSTFISSPLIVIYLLRHLNLNYTIYMVIVLAGTLFSLLFMELWGKITDIYGNYRTLCITSIMIPIIPILWIISPSPIYLALIPSIVGGISWAGFNLASGNFIYDNVNPQKRGMAVSYYNMLVGFGTFFGAGVGAILIKYLKTTFIQPILLIFIIGGLVRMVVVFFWLPKIQEVRKTKKLGKRGLKNIIFKQTKPTLIEEAHEIMSIPKYFKGK